MNDGEDPSRSHIIPVEHPERLMARLRGWDPVEDPFGSGLLRSFEQDMFSFFEPFTPPFTDTGYIRPQMLDMALFGYNPFASGLRTDQENRVQENVSRQPQAQAQPEPQARPQVQGKLMSLISESGITEYRSHKHPFTDDQGHSSSLESRWDADLHKPNVEIDYDTGRDGDVDTEFDTSSIHKSKRLPISSQKVQEDDVVIPEDIQGNADSKNIQSTNIRNEEHDTDSGFFREETKDTLDHVTADLNVKQVEETQPEISRNIDIQSGQQNAYISRVDTSDYDQTLVHGDVFGGVPGRFTNPLDLRSLQANTYEVFFET